MFRVTRRSQTAVEIDEGIGRSRRTQDFSYWHALGILATLLPAVWGLAIEFWSGNLHFWRAGDLFDSIIASLLILQNYRYQKAIHTSGGLVSKDESPSSSSSYI
jgi:hypothetical protein